VPAPNYHYHCHLRCEYNDSTATAGTPHSPLVGLMLDGRGLYGMYESGLTMPTNLDACGGHYGPVPATTINGVTYPAASNVYHYHMQHQARCRRGGGADGVHGDGDAHGTTMHRARRLPTCRRALAR
jgi:hypothetical protein